MKEEIAMGRVSEAYEPDVLGNGFEKLNLKLSNDYEGQVIATLVRRMANNKSEKAILYVHGFNDYFFQKDLAIRFSELGYHFYALDLRKYGRSYLRHQKFNNVRSILEYDEELDLSLKIIKAENNHEILLMGHSTGGLILTNYAVNHLKSELFHGLICNSPFYEFNLNGFERTVGIPILSFIGKYFPNIPISGGFSKRYGYSLHIEKYGEWNYSLLWKPHDIPKVTMGFIRAIRSAQLNIRNKLSIDVPALVMHSDNSVYDKHWSDKFKEGDAVLNVDHIKKYAHKINGDVTLREIEGGMHDLVLSKKPVREQVYKKICDWINNNLNKSQEAILKQRN
ncbi:alpha/beta hydrolase [Subsaximicrobium wynnwilliamsii]|uniref:Alpha/beta hydrolase n=1 Tax=Subsaximicrobium wynnwilliamsii TaxID=291179 RepID=A0A5C6ZMB3_9FLAO|nr:alpha/beta hydrolase [Subsaximicrobium wynnwilliamsii]TXD85590.1 alpha/beta hydrolase [Subsaximicrobium wynnwilliamsii]TXD90942.1 alpha/beta hydrolase [Subsaximicrobium wynnwilliamsii]TXE05450.1 alpha/beta hydrolase [Subsaximicrobium wynnwilliamsii]